MRKAPDTHLRRKCLQLAAIDARGPGTSVVWRSENLGSWRDIAARWWEDAGKVRLQFRTCQKEWCFQVSSIKRAGDGVKVILSDARKPVPEELCVSWGRISTEGLTRREDSWQAVQRWLRERFPGFQVLSVGRRPDLAHSLSGSFLRVLFRARGKIRLALIGDLEGENEDTRTALGQALLSLSAPCYSGYDIRRVYLLVAPGQSGILYHRAGFLNPARVRTEVWELGEGAAAIAGFRQSTSPPEPVEERDFRWPVLGPFKWSTQLATVLDLAPHLIRRYPRFQDYDSLRLWGLEFARVMGPDRDRISYGVGGCKTELKEGEFQCLRSLVDEILYYRRPDSPDTQHPYYRAQSERWLEALILENVSELFPELVPESVYPQIPVYLGKDAGRVDILGADRLGNLVVMELKVTADPDLPLQSLDYWGRAGRHNLNGDFERRGYFSGLRLSRSAPGIYLVSPVFSFHDSTERLLSFLHPSLEVWKIAVNEDWRSGVKVLGRTRIRCGDLIRRLPGSRVGKSDG